MEKKRSGFKALAAAMGLISVFAEKLGVVFKERGKSAIMKGTGCPPKDYGMYLISHNIYHRRGKKRCRK